MKGNSEDKNWIVKNFNTLLNIPDIVVWEKTPIKKYFTLNSVTITWNP